jgi:hypothetical protein
VPSACLLDALDRHKLEDKGCSLPAGSRQELPALAATAKVNDMMLVTRNTVEVADLGAKVLNPFEAHN